MSFFFLRKQGSKIFSAIYRIVLPFRTAGYELFFTAISSTIIFNSRIALFRYIAYTVYADKKKIISFTVFA